MIHAMSYRFIAAIMLVVPFAANARVFNIRQTNLPWMMESSTVMLNTQEASGGHQGTGFFYRFLRRNSTPNGVLVILTNRHVLKDAEKLSFKVPVEHNGSDLLQRIDFAYEKINMPVLYHPETNVDLCALLIQPEYDRLVNRGVRLSYFAFDASFLADEKEYSAMKQLDPFVMVGYPSGLVDDVNMQPIFRRGSIATRPSLDFQGRREFVADIPNFWGSSGSPVFQFDDGLFNQRQGAGVSMTMGSRLTLLGVSYAGCPVANRPGPVILDGAAVPRLSAISYGINNTAFVIKASRILELEKELERLFSDADRRKHSGS